LFFWAAKEETPFFREFGQTGLHVMCDYIAQRYNKDPEELLYELWTLDASSATEWFYYRWFMPSTCAEKLLAYVLSEMGIHADAPFDIDSSIINLSADHSASPLVVERMTETTAMMGWTIAHFATKRDVLFTYYRLWKEDNSAMAREGMRRYCECYAYAHSQDPEEVFAALEKKTDSQARKWFCLSWVGAKLRPNEGKLIRYVTGLTNHLDLE